MLHYLLRRLWVVPLALSTKVALLFTNMIWIDASEIKSPELRIQRSIFWLLTNVPEVDSLSYRTNLFSSKRISAWNRETNSSFKTISLSNWRPSRVTFLSSGMICRLRMRKTLGSREGDPVLSMKRLHSIAATLQEVLILGPHVSYLYHIESDLETTLKIAVSSPGLVYKRPAATTW